MIRLARSVVVATGEAGWAGPLIAPDTRWVEAVPAGLVNGTQLATGWSHAPGRLERTT